MAELYHLFSKGVRFYLCRQLGIQELDDKVHDIFVVVVQAIRRGELREPERLMGFVRTVVRRQVAAHIDKAVQARREQMDLDASARVADPNGNPEEVAIFNQKEELVRRIWPSFPAGIGKSLPASTSRKRVQEEICAVMILTETQFRLLKSRAKSRFGELGKKKLAQRTLNAICLRKFGDRVPLRNRVPIWHGSGSSGRSVDRYSLVGGASSESFGTCSTDNRSRPVRPQRQEADTWRKACLRMLDPRLVHATEELLEEYTFGRIPSRNSAGGRTLLVCPQCQSELDDIEEYKVFMKAGWLLLRANVWPRSPVRSMASRWPPASLVHGRRSLIRLAECREPSSWRRCCWCWRTAVIWRMQSSPVAMAPVATVKLVALRGGDGDAAHAPSGRPLDLVFDRRDLPADVCLPRGGGEFRQPDVERRRGSRTQFFPPRDDRCARAVLGAALSSDGQLLREFGLSVG